MQSFRLFQCFEREIRGFKVLQMNNEILLTFIYHKKVFDKTWLSACESLTSLCWLTEKYKKIKRKVIT